ncbi:MAG: chemotaxis protein CheV [Burkholderiales bacterium]|nr:chemotaxis protein CheV [Burkholderiales bacterium]
MGHSDNHLMSMVDQKARLAGSNRMELLLFSVGGSETFGINVFKVREVCETMAITRAPNMPAGVVGFISLRGSIIPVIDLATCLSMPFDGPRSKLIITEFSSHTQAFQVEDVDRIVRVDWDQVKSPQNAAANAAGLVTAITEISEGKLVSILDVEQILANVIGEDPVPALEPIQVANPSSVFFADDSGLARKKIIEVLERMKIPYQYAVNGAEALERLRAAAARAEQEGRMLKSSIGLILTDAEMPEMDGYVLTRHIKEDRRFEGIPVLMHSSLSSVANQKLGQQVGVDSYVPKFNPEDLAKAVGIHLQKA